MRAPPVPRDLIACSGCGRQYEVTHVRAGSTVRCECGKQLVVEVRAAHAPRPLNCANCGGAFAASATECSHCGSGITLEERRLSSMCPGCFARMTAEAQFCMECGLRIEPQALAAVPEDVSCPRCAGALRARRMAGTSLVECAHCGGLWLSPRSFEELCAKSEESAESIASAGDRPAGAAVLPARVTYLPCIRCGDRMVPRNFGGTSGVIVDVCREHGVWLDHSELENVLRFVRGGGLQRARRREAEDLEHRASLARRETSRSRDGFGGGQPFRTGSDDLEIDLGAALTTVARWIGGWLQR